MEPIKYLGYLSQFGLDFLFLTESILFETANNKRPNGSKVNIIAGREQKERDIQSILHSAYVLHPGTEQLMWV